ncbi:MFS transporter [Novispirillum sp. DQ9]|uniref:MFS transporter n=1 Tax=Novispirillum sp. DQ9 TaxID=3398612 RepID=UPI003C7BFDC1
MVRPIVSLLAVFLGVTLLQGAQGVLIALLPLRMVEAGLSTLAIGLVAVGYATGFLVGCLFSGRVIRAIGHIRAYSAFAALLSVASLAFAINVELVFWTALRFITGVCLAGLFTAADSWIGEAAPAERRGRVLSLYTLVSKIGLVAGPLALTLLAHDSAWPVMLIAALVSLSLVPMAATPGPSPALPASHPMGLRELFDLAPAAVTGAFAAGLANSAVISLVPAWGSGLGMTAAVAAGLVATVQFGSLLGQWPLGWLSDRFDRRRVIVAVSAFAAVAGMVTAALPLLAPDLPAWVPGVLVGLWAAASFSIYSICVAHAVDRAVPEQVVAATSALLFTWAAGSIVGPAVAALSMESLGPAGLFVHGGGVWALITAFTIWRLRRRPIPAATPESFVAIPQGASPVVSGLHPVAPAEPQTPPSDGAR